MGINVRKKLSKNIRNNFVSKLITTNLSISYISLVHYLRDTYRSENMNRNYYIKFSFIDTLNVYQFGNWFESSRWLWIKSMHFFIFYIVYMLFVSMLRLTILLQLEIYDTISAGNPHVLPFNKLRTFFIIVIDVVQFNKVYHLIIDRRNIRISNFLNNVNLFF